MNKDIYLEILLQLSYPDILKLCQVSQEYNYVCNSNLLWSKLFQRDFLSGDVEQPKEEYKLWFDIINKYTTKIISKLINHRKNFDNLQMIYDKIFIILGHYFFNIIDYDVDKHTEYVVKMSNDITSLFNINNTKLHDKVWTIIVKMFREINNRAD